MDLREKYCASDDVIKHRRDFDWLLEAVTKVTLASENGARSNTSVLQSNVECVQYLVEKKSLPVNCLSSDAGNTYVTLSPPSFPSLSPSLALPLSPSLSLSLSLCVTGFCIVLYRDRIFQ